MSHKIIVLCLNISTGTYLNLSPVSAHKKHFSPNNIDENVLTKI